MEEARWRIVKRGGEGIEGICLSEHMVSDSDCPTCAGMFVLRLEKLPGR